MMNRNRFPIRERSPTLAIWQAFTFTMIIVVPFIAEIFFRVGWVNWNSEKPDEIMKDFSRMFFKSLYMTFRIICYIVYIFRVLVIYSNWKKRNSNHRLFKLLRSEDNMVLVGACKSYLISKIVVLLTITVFFVFLAFSGNYITCYSAFDWYESDQ